MILLLLPCVIRLRSRLGGAAEGVPGSGGGAAAVAVQAEERAAESSGGGPGEPGQNQQAADIAGQCRGNH